MYSVASSTTSPYDLCPYTTASGPTITFSVKPSSTKERAAPAKPAKPAKEPCNGPQPKWMERKTAVEDTGKFCKDHNGALLRKLLLGGGYSNAEMDSYDTDKDRQISVCV
jgi:hypothetical protein